MSSRRFHVSSYFVMTITTIKLVLSSVFFFSTFFCSATPVYLFSWTETRQRSKFNRSHRSFIAFHHLISCITSFGGGIFLGACLLDLLPEVIHHTNTLIKSEFHYDNDTHKRYPIAELLIGLGLFLVLFLEQIVLFCQPSVKNSTRQGTKKPTIILSPEEEEIALTTTHDQDPLITTNTPMQYPEMTGEQKDETVMNRTRLTMTRNFILLLSLIIHSLFEGIALGSTEEEKPFFELFFAIIIHKSIIAFSVGLKLMKTNNRLLIYFFCFLFALATPVGIGIVLSMQQLLPNSPTANLIHGVLRAFACGTFFYITFFDILPHELNLSSNHRHSSSNLSPLLKAFFIFLGFSFIGFLSFLMK